MTERERPDEVDPAEQGNYEGVSGGETTPQSGAPDAEAAQEGVGEDEPAEEAGGPEA